MNDLDYNHEFRDWLTDYRKLQDASWVSNVVGGEETIRGLWEDGYSPRAALEILKTGRSLEIAGSYYRFSVISGGVMVFLLLMAFLFKQPIDYRSGLFALAFCCFVAIATRILIRLFAKRLIVQNRGPEWVA